jgi:hypothetical protein
MRTYTKNRRRLQVQVESLEGKCLLSTGSLLDQVAPHVRAAPIVGQQSAVFSGTLTGSYSNVHAPGIPNIVSYVTSGTLIGLGPTRLRGTLSGRLRYTGQFADQLIMRNSGGSMIVNVFRSATPGTYSYEVVRARGSDTVFVGTRGTLMITQDRTFSVPFFSSGNATMTFTAG